MCQAKSTPTPKQNPAKQTQKLKQELKVGQEVDLELTFDNGETIELKQIKAIDRSSVLDTHKPQQSE